MGGLKVDAISFLDNEIIVRTTSDIFLLKNVSSFCFHFIFAAGVALTQNVEKQAENSRLRNEAFASDLFGSLNAPLASNIRAGLSVSRGNLWRGSIKKLP